MKAFVSYSWDDDQHKDWVRRFADELIRNGIETTLDQYDLSIGSDRFVFMERAVREADCILFICTPDYVQRANDRTHGVGAETTLVSSHFFESHRDKHFIPILRAIDGLIPYTPDYLASLIFLDFRNDSDFEKRMEELLRHLHGQPKHPKPVLGEPPRFDPLNEHAPDAAHDDGAEYGLVARLITFLEDRRVLFSQIWGMQGLASEGTIKSIQEIRQRLREDRERVRRDSALADALWNMQEACRTFLDGYDSLGNANVLISIDTHVLVHDFREIFRNELAKLSEQFDVPMRQLIPQSETLLRNGIGNTPTEMMFSEHAYNLLASDRDFE